MDSQGPAKIGEILSRLFAARGWGRKQEILRLERAWVQAAGSEIARNTRVAGIKRQILEIEVRGAILLQELASFSKRQLLEAIRRVLPESKIADLRFRSAAWDE